MKIENIKSYLVYSKGHRAGMIGGKSWLFVKVETDAGIHGWGEAYTQLDRDWSIQAHVEELGRYIVGRDPFNIKHTTQMAYDDYAGRRGSMEFYCALSGIEQALWDIVGKKLRVPVYQLLGGACRDKIRGLCQRLVRRGEGPRGLRDDGQRGGGGRFHGVEVRPVPRAVAAVRGQGGRGGGGGQHSGGEGGGGR